MKALSLWQPWATLVAIGAKKFETRSWSTNYRGPLAIHAALRLDEDQKLLAQSSHFKACLSAFGFTVKTLPLGAFVCIVDLVDVFPVEQVTPTIIEAAFGDYTPGRFAWKLENVRELLPPKEWRGHQRLWNLSDRLIEELKIRESNTRVLLQEQAHAG